MTADDAGCILDRLHGEYRLSWREKLGWAFGGFWRSLFASSLIVGALTMPLVWATSPWVVGVRESPWLGGAVNFGSFGVAVAYAYVCASTKYVFDAQGVRIYRGWPFPSKFLAREGIQAARIVEGMFCRFISLELRGGKIRELVLPASMLAFVERDRVPVSQGRPTTGCS